MLLAIIALENKEIVYGEGINIYLRLVFELYSIIFTISPNLRTHTRRQIGYI